MHVQERRFTLDYYYLILVHVLQVGRDLVQNVDAMQISNFVPSFYFYSSIPIHERLLDRHKPQLFTRPPP